jgi:hypothetical protein
MTCRLDSNNEKGALVRSGASNVTLPLVLINNELNDSPSKFAVNPIETGVPPLDELLHPPVVNVPSSLRPSEVVLKPGTIAAPKLTPQRIKPAQTPHSTVFIFIFVFILPPM